METLKRAFWALDRHFGGHRPPSRPRGRFLRHPVLCGLVAAAFSGGLASWSIGRFEPGIVVYALCVGVFWWLLLMAERKRLDHYGFAWRKTPEGQD